MMNEPRIPALRSYSNGEILTLFSKATAGDRQALLIDYLILLLFSRSYTGQAAVPALKLQKGFSLFKNAPLLTDIYAQIRTQPDFKPYHTNPSLNECKQTVAAFGGEVQWSQVDLEQVDIHQPTQLQDVMLMCDLQTVLTAFKDQMQARVDSRIANCRSRLAQVNKLLATKLPEDSPLHDQFIQLRDQLRQLSNLKEHNLFDPDNAGFVMQQCEQFFGDLEVLRGYIKTNNKLTSTESFYALDFWTIPVGQQVYSLIRVAWLSDHSFHRFDQWLNIMDNVLLDYQCYQFRDRHDTKTLADEINSQMYDQVFGRLYNFPNVSIETIKGRRLNTNATASNIALMDFIANIDEVKAGITAAQQQYRAQVSLDGDNPGTANKVRKVTAPHFDQAFTVTEYDTLVALREMMLSVLVLGSFDLPDPAEIVRWDEQQYEANYRKLNYVLTFLQPRIDNYQKKIKHLNFQEFYRSFEMVAQSVHCLMNEVQQRCTALDKARCRILNRLLDSVVSAVEQCLNQQNTKKKQITAEIKAFCAPSSYEHDPVQTEALATLLGCFDSSYKLLIRVNRLANTYPEEDDIKAELADKVQQLIPACNQWSRVLLQACDTWFKRMLMSLTAPVKDVGDIHAQIGFLMRVIHKRDHVLSILSARVKLLARSEQVQCNDLMQKLSELTVAEQYYTKVVDNALPILQGHQSVMQTALGSLPNLLSMIKIYLSALSDDTLDSIIKQSVQNHDQIKTVQEEFTQACRIVEQLQIQPITIAKKQQDQFIQLKAFFERYRDYCAQLVYESANLSYYAQVKTAVRANEHDIKQMLDLVDTFENLLVCSGSLYSRFKEAVHNAENHPTTYFYQVMQDMEKFVAQAASANIDERVTAVNGQLRSMFELIAKNVHYQVDLISEGLSVASRDRRLF